MDGFIASRSISIHGFVVFSSIYRSVSKDFLEKQHEDAECIHT